MFSLFRAECEKICGEYSKYLESPKSDIADLALPCFHIAKSTGKNPVEIARSLEREFGKKKKTFIAEVKALGPYVNFYINEKKFSHAVVKELLKITPCKKTGKNIMVEYSSPNSNKPLHIGHLRNDCIGMSISNILEAKGNNVIRANIVNDRGVHICKTLVAYQKLNKIKNPDKKGDHFVGDLYVAFEKASKENPQLTEDAYDKLKKWEAGDKDTRALWLKLRKFVLDGFHETYDRFGSKFDVWFFESEFYNKAAPLIEEGMKLGVFEKNEKGDIIAKLEPEMPNKTFLRSDGTSIYATNDLALTKHKFDKYKLNKSIWVVASEQNLYFKQLFKVFEKLRYDWHHNCYHLSYGLVNLPSGRMKSREGTVVDADDIMNEMQELAKKEISSREKENKISKKELEERSMAIALSAIKYFMLKVEPSKDILFNPEDAISFEGDTGPYIQYTYARAKSILNKSKKKPLAGELGQKEKDAVILLSKFPDIVEQAEEQMSPHVIAVYLHELAAKFNTYYHDSHVIGDKNEQALLAFVTATANVLKKGMELLGIQPIEKM
ncbi:MAG TPA: arginine--tRNA ligase [archaeon]|nr:arginine--tRNA ligase [archaeon]